MKILYFFQELNTPMFQWQRQHFLDELPHHGIEIETFNPLMYANPEEANEKLLKHISEGKYDLFISNMGYFRMLYVETLESIKRLGVPTMRIAWDNLMIPYIDEVLSPHFDLVWLTAKETVHLYAKWGVTSFFAPYAANPYTYQYRKTNVKRSACFVGNPHGSRALMINSLTKQRIPVDLYCGGRGKDNNKTDSANQPKYDIINPSTQETIINRFRFKEGRKLMLGSIVNKLKGVTTVEENKSLSRNSGLSHEEMVSTYHPAKV